jgi:biopolymer transport protein ExbD/biopolymer transport protein TolR
MAVSIQKNNGSAHRPLAEINVTPMVDVMLVLLIVFMITAPMMTMGLKVDLPQAKSAQALKLKPPVLISIDKQGNIAVDADAVSTNELLNIVKSRMDGDLTRIIQIKADRDVTYAPIIEIVDSLVSNGMTHIALVSDPKSKNYSSQNQNNKNTNLDIPHALK